MRRKATKQSPARNAEQQRLMDWVHEQPCAACRNEGPVEAHHILGETYAVKIDYVKTNLGHWALLPLCKLCHEMLGDDKPSFLSLFGRQVDLWSRCVHEEYFKQKELMINMVIYSKIMGTQK